MYKNTFQLPLQSEVSFLFLQQKTADIISDN